MIETIAEQVRLALSCHLDPGYDSEDAKQAVAEVMAVLRERLALVGGTDGGGGEWDSAILSVREEIARLLQ